MNFSNYTVYLVGVSQKTVSVNVPFLPQIGSYFTFKRKTYIVSNTKIDLDRNKIDIYLSSL